MAIGGLTRRSRQSSLGILVPIILFPVVLVVVVFSSCDVRKRSAKHACKAGDVQQCLEVAKYYEAKSEGEGIINFAMSNPDTATIYYFRACKLKSSVGCDGMMKMNRDSNTVRSTTGVADIADALIDACADQVDNSCKNLESFMDEGDWVANRSAIAFKKGCDSGNPRACYLVGNMASQNQGSLHNNFDEVLPAFDKACAAHIKDSCERAKSYHDEQTKRQTAPPEPAKP
jgi:TPR repeat protein